MKLSRREWLVALALAKPGLSSATDLTCATPALAAAWEGGPLGPGNLACATTHSGFLRFALDTLSRRGTDYLDAALSGQTLNELVARWNLINRENRVAWVAPHARFPMAAILASVRREHPSSSLIYRLNPLGEGPDPDPSPLRRQEFSSALNAIQSESARFSVRRILVELDPVLRANPHLTPPLRELLATVGKSELVDDWMPVVDATLRHGPDLLASELAYRIALIQEAASTLRALRAAAFTPAERKRRVDALAQLLSAYVGHIQRGPQWSSSRNRRRFSDFAYAILTSGPAASGWDAAQAFLATVSYGSGFHPQELSPASARQWVKAAELMHDPSLKQPLLADLARSKEFRARVLENPDRESWSCLRTLKQSHATLSAFVAQRLGPAISYDNSLLVSEALSKGLLGGASLAAATRTVSAQVRWEIELMERFLKLHQDGTEKLKPTTGKERGIAVYQGEGRFLRAGDRRGGLYSFYAHRCGLAITVAAGQNGRPVEVGLAHIDPNMTESQTERFFRRAAQSGAVTTHIIGGNHYNTLKCFRAASRHGTVRFVDCDERESRFDAAFVSAGGEVRYGHVPHLEDSRRAKDLDTQRAIVKVRTIDLLEP